MRKNIWIPNIILSLIISIIINFNARSISIFLIGSLILGLVIFGIFTLIIKSIQNIRVKNTKKAVIYGVLSIIVILIFCFGYLLIISNYSLRLPAVTPAHFRTNILTGQCDFGGYSPCLISDPWYYKYDCDISYQEKIEIFKKSIWYDKAIENCNILCQEDDANFYCLDKVGFANGISCKDITSCDTISCD